MMQFFFFLKVIKIYWNNFLIYIITIEFQYNGYYVSYILLPR